MQETSLSVYGNDSETSNTDTGTIIVFESNSTLCDKNERDLMSCSR